MMEPYGIGATSYHAAGDIAGIRQLVDDFYTLMDESIDYYTIRQMHPKDLHSSKDKLSCFLSGWMGGEELYAQKYGSINIPQFHAFIKVGVAERDMWIACMREALQQQNYAESFKHYLIQQLSIPAERVRMASVAAQKEGVQS